MKSARAWGNALARGGGLLEPVVSSEAPRSSRDPRVSRMARRGVMTVAPPSRETDARSRGAVHLSPTRRGEAGVDCLGKRDKERDPRNASAVLAKSSFGKQPLSSPSLDRVLTNRRGVVAKGFRGVCYPGERPQAESPDRIKSTMNSVFSRSKQESLAEDSFLTWQKHFAGQPLLDSDSVKNVPPARPRYPITPRASRLDAERDRDESRRRFACKTAPRLSRTPNVSEDSPRRILRQALRGV